MHSRWMDAERVRCLDAVFSTHVWTVEIRRVSRGVSHLGVDFRCMHCRGSGAEMFGNERLRSRFTNRNSSLCFCYVLPAFRFLAAACVPIFSPCLYPTFRPLLSSCQP